jgi:hypothetical protein
MRYSCLCLCRYPPPGGGGSYGEGYQTGYGGGKGQHNVRREGDWDCGACSAHNFASRGVCFKCHAQKPGGCVRSFRPSNMLASNDFFIRKKNVLDVSFILDIPFFTLLAPVCFRRAGFRVMSSRGGSNREATVEATRLAAASRTNGTITGLETGAALNAPRIISRARWHALSAAFRNPKTCPLTLVLHRHSRTAATSKVAATVVEVGSSKLCGEKEIGIAAHVRPTILRAAGCASNVMRQRI